MIALTLPCDVDDASLPPFVARLCDAGTSIEDGRSDALLIGQDENRSYFQLDSVTFSLPRIENEPLDGDVVYIEPNIRSARRWIRARSRHNTLLVTENCDQLCKMCSQPPKKTVINLFPHFEAACALAPESAVIGLSGGEPTLHKDELFSLLSGMATSRSDLKFHVLTNGQHFDGGDSGTLRKLRNVMWGVPLYAAEAAVHDEIVGKAGAFDRVLESFAILGEAGAAIELRTVLMRRNADALPALASFSVDSLSFVDVWAIMQLERAGFAKNRWTELFFDHSADFSFIADALSWAMLHGVNVALYNFPLCTVPDEWRRFAARSISDWKNKYVAACEGCAGKSQCAGFFEWHPEDHGYERLAPL